MMLQKVDGAKRPSSRRNTALIMAAASVMLLAVVICVAVGFVPAKTAHRNTVMKLSAKMSTSNDFVIAACNGTVNPQLCISNIEGLVPDLHRHHGAPLDVLKLAVKGVIDFVQQTTGAALPLSATPGLEHIALHDCFDLFSITVDELNQALSHLISLSLDFNNPSLSFKASYAQMFISAALTNQDTCIEGFSNTNGALKSHMQIRAQSISDILTPCLAMANRISDLTIDHDDMTPAPSPDISDLAIDHHGPSPGPAPTPSISRNRRVLMPSGKNAFPAWLSWSEHRLLQASASDLDFDAVVNQDGSGDFIRISDAVNAAPHKSRKRYVIYVKAGVYHEYVEIPSNKTFLTLIGEGMDYTIVTGNRNAVDNWTTFHSATFTVKGEGFIARDISFENSAGPEKHQAVALLVASHQSVFYRCSMKGYQDTLYAHSLSQFYRECEIYGTVDFIFGNAAAVFQKCVIMARKPMEGQAIMVTAQGRKEREANTGFSIHYCNVTAAPDLIPVKKSFKTYLGRPWKEYSRTVFMQSYLDDMIEPQGWSPWNASDFALNTLYYGEYKNYGAGAPIAARVNWTGYHILKHPSQVKKFTVARLILGKKWLKSTGVPFIAGLKRGHRD